MTTIATPGLRVRLVGPLPTLVPGEPASLVVEVTNTQRVIEGVRPEVDAGPADVTCEASPDLLPLFPNGVGTVTVRLTPSPRLPAGHLLVHLVLRSSVDDAATATQLLSLAVAPAPAVALEPVARRKAGRHRTRFELRVRNEGNVALDLDLGASDPMRQVALACRPASLTLPPGASETAWLDASAPRRLLGTDLDHVLDVVATAPEAHASTTVTFRQRPLVPRGARTILLLATIVAVWAAVLVIALNRALASDPPGKEVPASFYATSHRSGSGAVPAGAVPKSGLAVGVGGTIAGVVDAASTGAGVGRITVQAYSGSPSSLELVASAASGSDGSWSIPGLLPGSYRLELSAPGFTTVWYPAAPTAATASPVDVRALATTGGIDATISGLPGSISGTVATGESPGPTVTVTVLAEQGAGSAGAGTTAGQVVATTTTSPQGAYTVSGLPTPGTYDLSFSAPGFAVASATDVLTGGEQDQAGTTTLTASPGSISGTVTADGQPLGGVKVQASGAGASFATATPTSGQVGTFTLGSLPTPATYLLTFTATGYGTETVAEPLGPGQALTGVSIALSGGAGDVSGTVSGPNGQPLGGVTVTVNGAAAPVTTQTATAGQAGTYLVTGLATPGSYTLTFSLDGYVSQTVPVDLASNGSASGIDVTLAPATGSLAGTVSDGGGTGVAGATVTVTDGAAPVTTTTTSSPPGSFEVTGLAPGTYAVTATATGYEPTTVQVTVQAGAQATATVTLTPTAGATGTASGSSGSS
jgi:hypothetical protein